MSLGTAALGVGLAALPSAAHAVIAGETWTGGTDSSWITAANWNLTTVPTNTINVTITNNGVTTMPVVGDPGQAALKVTINGNGTGTSLKIIEGGNLTVGTGGVNIGTGNIVIQDTNSFLFNTGNLVMGANTSFTLQNGGNYTSSNSSAISVGLTNTAALTVNGTGSKFSLSTASLNIGNAGLGNGTLIVANGGNLAMGGSLNVGVTGGTGNVTVSDAGSKLLVNSGSLTVGIGGGTGNLTASNGATITVLGFNVGTNTGTGTVLLDGADTSLTASSVMNIVNGNVTVANGANIVLNSTNDANFGSASGGNGTINVGAPANGTATAPGFIRVGNFAQVNSTRSATVQFNTNATASSPYFLTRNGTATANAIGFKTGVQIVNTAGYTIVPAALNGNIVVNGGTLEVDGPAGTSAGMIATVATGATLAGNGTINATASIDGRVAPGTSNSTGILLVSGNITLNSTATVGIRLGGTSSGSGYDGLYSNGAITQGGTLNVTLTNGFTPSAGQTFTVIAGASQSGNFTTVLLPTLGTGLTWDQSALGTSGNITVMGTGPTVSSLTAPGNTTYHSGDTLTFTANFSDPVTVTGTPRVVLTVGSATAYATYDSGNSTSTALKFNYVVQVGDSASNGIAVNSLDLNGGTINATTGGAASILTFTAPTTTSVLVDGVKPSILQSPQGRNIGLGGRQVLSVAAAGSGLSYQWRKGGNPISNATSSTLTLDPIQSSDGGSYDVVVTNVNGNVTSGSTTMAVLANPLGYAAQVAVDADGVTAYFSIEGSGNKTVLLGAFGPSLTGTGNISDPQIVVTKADGTAVTSNDNWSGDPTLGGLVSSYANVTLTNGSKDAVISQSFTPGSYVVRVTGVSGATGKALLLIGDEDTNPVSRLAYVGIRAKASATATFTGAFKIINSAAKKMLVRGVGTAVGATAALADPAVGLYDSSSTLQGGNDNWGGDITLSAAFTQGGAFALDPAGKDAAVLVSQRVGADQYTATLSPGMGSGGALLEVYDLNGTNNATYAPIVVIPPQDQTAASGNVSFTAKAVGGGTLSYAWKHGTNTINGATSATLALSNVTTADSGNYTVTVSSTAGAATAVATAALKIAPAITSNATASATYGTAFTYNITASNGATTFGATGLPAWATVNSTTGVLSGTPTATGNVSVTVNATNTDGTGTANLTISVGQKALTVSGAGAQDKIYDGGTTAILIAGSPTPVGVVGSDNVTVSSTSATAAFGNKTVGSNKPITLSGFGLSGTDAAKYSITQPTATANITAKGITITGATATGKTYDGLATATGSLTGASLSGRVDGDVVQIDPTTATAAFPDKNVGPNRTVTFSNVGLSGADATNYSLTQPTATASIMAKTINATNITATSRTYDSTKTAALVTSGAGLSGTINGDDIHIGTGSATGTFDTKVVGVSKTVTVGGLTLTGTDANNYQLATYTTTADITVKGVTVSGITATDRVYDRSKTAALVTSAALPNGLISTDDAHLSLSGATGMFADKTVGTSKPVTISGLAITGTDAGNYQLTQPTATATISAKGVTITGATASDKVYDGLATATPSVTGAQLSGVIDGDSVQINGTGMNASFADKTVGPNRTVAFANVGLSGTDASNYSLTQPTATASITAKTINATNITATSRVYDASKTAALVKTGAGLSGVIGSDAVNLDATNAAGTFADKNIGTAKPVTVSGLQLTGGDAGNYSLATYTTPADITAKGVTVTGITASSRVYDRTNGAALSTGGATPQGLISTDDVHLSVSGATGTFLDKTIGTSRVVTVAGLTLTGTDAGNYALTQPTTTADITGKNLTVSGLTVTTRNYDGTTAGTIATPGNLVGIISGDTVNLNTAAATLTFNDKNVGVSKVVTVAGLALSGADAGNYTITQPAATGTITQAPVRISIAANDTIYDGTPKGALVFIEPAVAATTTYSGTGSSAPVNAGTYTVTVTITDSNYTGTSSASYTIAKATQTITFPTPAALTVGQALTLGATASSNLPVTYSVVSGNATLAGSSLTLGDVNPVVVRATQAGNGNYQAATLDRTLNATNKLTQTITFNAISDRLSDSGSFSLVATASSGLPVSFAVTSGPAMLSGSTVTLTGLPGTVVVTASQAGNAVYAAAPNVTASFNITAATLSTYFGKVNTGSGTATGDVAAALPAKSNTGELLIVAPGAGINNAISFTLNADGTFTVTVTVPSTTTSGVDNGRTPSPQLVTPDATTTLTIKGSIVNGVLSGTISPLGLTFSAPVQPAAGPSANVAGFYTSSTLQQTNGSAYSIVGSNNNVLVLAQTPAVTTGGLTTLNSDGSFGLQLSTGSGTATIKGSVDAPTTTVSGTISVTGQPDTSFAGVISTTARTDRLINLSSRVQVGTGDKVLVTGFVIGGSSPKPVLVRAIGPGLSAFGIQSVLANPKISIYDATGAVIAQNDDWGNATSSATLATTFSRVGAFTLKDNSADAALLVTLNPGQYTAAVTGTGTGVALAEIYDASTNPQADYQRLVNISSRGQTSAGENALVGGFVITGNSPKKVLIRGIGPGLTPFGVAGVLADPRLQVYQNGTLIAENDNWSTPLAGGSDAATVAAAATNTGAFALPANSKDAALILTLAPGQYTAQVVPADGVSSGVALVEIYEIPQQ